MLSAQSKEANIWYFGNEAGLDFNPGPPIALTNSKMYQSEGSASIADINGNLLFYTNGETVWDKTHTIMLNGTGLIGNNSTTHCLIVHNNYQPSIYYIFHSEAAGGNDMYYSTVDMTQNGGLGSVASKNIPFWKSNTEKFAAIGHSRIKNDYWLATVDNNGEILIFSISAGGLNPTPKKFAMGSNTVNGGQIKFSSDGTKLAFADSYLGVTIADFNRTTGDISNIRHINGFIYPYGIEFSPDSKLLYISDLAANRNILYQTVVPNTNSHESACYKIDSIKINNHFGALQLAPDSKIYHVLGSYNYVSVIRYPNNIGNACGYLKNGVFLSGKTGAYGLPSFNQNYFIKKPATFISHPCFGDTAAIAITQGTLLIDSVFWEIGPLKSAFKYAANSKIKFRFSDSAYTQVTIRIKHIDGWEDTLFETVKIRPIPSLDLGSDTSFCEVDTIKIVAKSNATGFTWHNGSPEKIFITNTPGKYWVTASLVGCSITDSITITQNVNPTVNLGKDTALCDKPSYTINAGSGFANYQWSTGASGGPPSISVSTTGEYWVTVTDTNSCQASDTVTLSFKESPKVTLADSVLCEVAFIELQVPGIYDKYLWSNGTTDYITQIKDMGAVWVKVSNMCGQTRADAWVRGCRYDPPVIYIPNAFTPNGDGLNNVFKVYTENIRKFNMKIFNRWGQLIFESSDTEHGWDGNYEDKPVPQDVYMYVISTMGLNRKLNTYFGNVTLIR